MHVPHDAAGGWGGLYVTWAMGLPTWAIGWECHCKQGVCMQAMERPAQRLQAQLRLCGPTRHCHPAQPPAGANNLTSPPSTPTCTAGRSGDPGVVAGPHAALPPPLPAQPGSAGGHGCVCAARGRCAWAAAAVGAAVGAAAVLLASAGVGSRPRQQSRIERMGPAAGWHAAGCSTIHCGPLSSSPHHRHLTLPSALPSPSPCCPRSQAHGREATGAAGACGA